MWQNSTTLNVTKLKNLKCGKTKKTQNETQLKKLKCDKTQKLKM